MTNLEYAQRLFDTDSDDEAETSMTALMQSGIPEIQDQATACAKHYLSIKGRDDSLLPRLMYYRSRRFQKAIEELLKICKERQ